MTRAACRQFARLCRSGRISRTFWRGAATVWRSWGEGPPLVLLHGGYGSWTHWLRNIEVLALHYTVWAPDLPGLGGSDLPVGGASPEAVVASIAHGCDQLIGAATPYDLVGFSFGSMVAGLLAQAHSTRVRSLALVGAVGLGLAPPRPIPLLRPNSGMSRLEVAKLQHRNLSLLMLHDPAGIDDLAVLLQVRSTKAARVRSMTLMPPDCLMLALRGLAMPVSAIWGELDATAWPDMQARVDRLKNVRAGIAVTIVPDAGHWVQYEAAQAFDAWLMDHLQRASDAGALA